MIVGSATKLNLIPAGVMPVVYINQGDAGYDKEFLVYNGDSPYNVPAGVSATIRGKKADGYGVTEAAALTEGSNLVTITITEQMVAAEGANLYELVFVDTDGLRIATINMVWAVKQDALGDAVISDSDLDYASQVMDQLQSVSAFKAQLDSNTASIEANTDGLAAETAARIAADATLQSNINTEASTRAVTDTSLQAQINQIVAPSGEAPSVAEVQNARIGANGVTYQTLGEAIRTNDIELKNQLGTVKTVVPAMERGGINRSTGAAVSTTTILRTQEYIPTKNVLSVSVLSGYKCACIFYDDTYAFDSSTDLTSDAIVNITGTYMRVIVIYDPQATIYADTSNAPIIQMLVPAEESSVSELKDEVNKTITIVSNAPAMEQGTISGEGDEQSSSTRIRTKQYIPVKNIESISVSDGYTYTVLSYDENLTFVTTTGFMTEPKTAFTGAYIRIVVAYEDMTTAITPSVDTGLTIRVSVGAPRTTINILQDAYSPDPMNSGCVFVGDEFWCFDPSSDDGSSYESVYVLSYDIDTNTLTHLRTMTHNLGHVNSVSYCAETDSLILGNGSNDYTLSGVIYILENVSEVGDTLNRSDCIAIDVGMDLGFKVNCVWGDPNVKKFDIAYVCSNDSHSIYRIQLGKGAHDLGNGTLIPGATGFNGTYKILGQWEWGFVGRDYENVVQGMVFWKNRLIWGWGHNHGVTARVATLYNGGVIEIESANYETTDDNGKPILRYPAGMVKFGDFDDYLGICSGRHLWVVKDWN